MALNFPQQTPSASKPSPAPTPASTPAPKAKAKIGRPKGAKDSRHRKVDIKTFSRLHALGEPRLTKINNELARGTPVSRVARMIQQEWGEYQDVAANTLEQQLHRYKQAFETGRLIGVKVTLDESETQLKFLKAGNVNVMEEMVALIRLQANRVQMFYDRERAIGMPMSGVDKIIDAYKDLLVTAQKLKFDLGLDVFNGPLPAARGMQQTTQLPDGTIVRQQMVEAVQLAESILNKYDTPKVVSHDNGSAS